jgi:glycosyltransferase 2 family protein
MRNLWRILLGTVIGALASWYLLKNVSLPEIISTLRSVPPGAMGATFVLMCSAYFFRLHRWKMLLSPLRDVPTMGLLSPLAIGLLGNVLPGRVGELLKGLLLGRKYSLSLVGSMATVVAARLCDLIVTLLLCFWVFHFQVPAGHFSSVMPDISLQVVLQGFSKVSLGLATLLVVLIYLMTSHRSLLHRILQRLQRAIPLLQLERLAPMIDEVGAAFGALRNWRILGYVVIDSCLLWGITILAFAPLYWAFDLQQKSIASLVTVRVMISVFITVLPTPAFLGSFSAGAMVALRDVFGESEVVAASFGVLVWGLNTLLVLLAGLLYVVVEGISLQRLLSRRAGTTKTLSEP